MIFIGIPLASYLSLAMLPRGRSALIGLGIAALATGVLWVLVVPGDSSGVLGALVMLVASAILLAALVQSLRSFLGEGRPAWTYPAIVGLALLGAGLPLLKILGM